MNLTITDDMIIKFVTGVTEYTIDKMILNENGTEYEIYDGGSTPSHDYSQDYFTIESLEDNNDISLNKGYSANSVTFYYSNNDGTSWSSDNNSKSWTLNKGDKLIIKATTAAWATGPWNYWKFSSTKTYNVYGNVMSLLNGDNFYGTTNVQSNALIGLFNGSEYLIDASNLILPATSLNSACYLGMFQNCRSLTTAPELPATTLASDCYTQMFQNCIALTTAPELTASALQTASYNSMFAGCSSLNYIKCLATNISASRCLNRWVSGVAASGTFVKAASMSSWPAGSSGIPSGWTVQDAA